MATREWKTIKEYEDILFQQYGGIYKNTINPPAGYNSFRPPTNFEKLDPMSICRERRDIGGVVFSGAGGQAFCSGGGPRVQGG